MTKNGGSSPNIIDDAEADDVPTDGRMRLGIITAARKITSAMDASISNKGTNAIKLGAMA